MTQANHDEKVALVEKAKGIVEGKIKSAKVTLRGETLESSGGAFNFYTQELNLLLALQSFFKRHEDNGEGGCSYYGCSNPCHDYTGLGCDVPSICNKPDSYPCHEAVTTADIIVNGVKE